MKANPRLTQAKAAFLAETFGVEKEEGRIDGNRLHQRHALLVERVVGRSAMGIERNEGRDLMRLYQCFACSSSSHGTSPR